MITTEMRFLAEQVSANTSQDPRLVAAYAAWTLIGEPGDRIANQLIDHLGPASALEAVKDAVSAKEIGINLDDHELKSSYGRWTPKLSANALIVALRHAVRANMKLVIPTGSSWPKKLDDLGRHKPFALWVLGDHELLGQRSVAVVGARAATGYGEHVTMEFAGDFVAAGLVVVSGAAYGIDGMAHRAALAARGKTVAVMAGGLDKFYPSGHDSLLQRIKDAGAVVSELPPGALPSKWRFLQRNRIIAALAEVTVVIEAGYHSGSLNAAGHASGLRRPLAAVPGPVTSVTSAGCHRLIRDFGAVCATVASDVLELVTDAPVVEADDE